MKKYKYIFILIIFLFFPKCSGELSDFFPDIMTFDSSGKYFSGYKMNINLPIWGEGEIDGFPPISSLFINGSYINEVYLKTDKIYKKLKQIKKNDNLQEVLLTELKIDQQGVLDFRSETGSYKLTITSTAGFRRSSKLDKIFSTLLDEGDIEITEVYPLENSSSTEKISTISPKLISNVKYGDSFYVPMTRGTYYKGRFFHPVIYEKDLPETDYKTWKWKWDTFSIYIPYDTDDVVNLNLILYLPGLRSCKETMLGFTDEINKGKKKFVVLSTDNPYHGERSGDPDFVCGLTSPEKFVGDYNPFYIRKMILETFAENLFLIKEFLKFGCCNKKFSSVIIFSHSLDAAIGAMFVNYDFVKATIFLDPYYTLRYFIPTKSFDFLTGYSLQKLLWSVDIIDTVSPMLYSKQFSSKPILFELAGNDEVVPLNSQILFSEDVGAKCSMNKKINSYKKCVIFPGLKHKSFFVHKTGLDMKIVMREFINKLP